MKLKKGLIAATVAVALIVPTTVFAATSTSTAAIKIRGLLGIDGSKLTASQLADVTDYAKKAAELQKSLLDKMVANGSMTQAQADAEKAQIDKNLANGDIFVGAGNKGHGDFKGNRIDTSKFTDAQKTTLLGLEKEQLTLQKELTKLLVEQKLITQAQADTYNKEIDTAIAALSTTNFNNRMLGAFCSIKELQGVTLTDTQKTAILGWSAKAADVHKKIVALYKDAGVITQAQADTMNTQIDAKASDPLSFNRMGNGMTNGMMGKGMMGKGMMGGKGDFEGNKRGGHGGNFDRGAKNGCIPGSNQNSSGSAIE